MRYENHPSHYDAAQARYGPFPHVSRNEDTIMRPYPECNRDMPELRQKVGQLFESLPELTETTFTTGGIQYRARRSGHWVTMDVKAKGRGWDCWTELALPSWYAWQRQKGAA